MPESYCERLRIDVPDLAAVQHHREANTYALLIVALLEHGRPMTLLEVAARFESAGVAPASFALASLKKCKPARPPVYRDGDHYCLDVHSEELDFCLLRLDLRPARVPRLAVVRPDPPPLPGPLQRLTPAELDEAFRGAGLYAWSAQRLALAILDAHGSPMTPAAVTRALAAHLGHERGLDGRQFDRRNSPVAPGADGRFEIRDHDAVVAARRAVRARVAAARARAAARHDPDAFRVQEQLADERRSAHAAELARLRRAIIHVFPAVEPACVTVLDQQQRRIDTFFAAEFAAARARIASFEVIGGLEVRHALRALGLSADDHRLAELGPAQKTRQLNRQGRTLKITPALLVSGSCDISRPFGDPGRMATYLERGATTLLRRRLEADVKSLFALHEFGRLHHRVRLRWGFLDEWLPAPWVHRDEPSLHWLMDQAMAEGGQLEVVSGSAPGFTDPWSRAVRCSVGRSLGYGLGLADERGLVIDTSRVQLARRAGGDDRRSAPQDPGELET